MISEVNKLETKLKLIKLINLGEMIITSSIKSHWNSLFMNRLKTIRFKQKLDQES